MTSRAQRRKFDTQPLPEELPQGLAAMPLDHYVIWDGGVFQGRPGSRCSRVLRMVDQPWTPVSLRELALRGTSLADDAVRPKDVREAIRQHQRALGARYLLVRKSAEGDYLTVTDVPAPAARRRALGPDHVILTRTGARFEAIR